VYLEAAVLSKTAYVFFSKYWNSATSWTFFSNLNWKQGWCFQNLMDFWLAPRLLNKTNERVRIEIGLLIFAPNYRLKKVLDFFFRSEGKDESNWFHTLYFWEMLSKLWLVSALGSIYWNFKSGFFEKWYMKRKPVKMSTVVQLNDCSGTKYHLVIYVSLIFEISFHWTSKQCLFNELYCAKVF
jgi:hypothetical protein